MTIKKLLTATSIMALTATSAQALDITNTGTDFVMPLANELCLGDAGVAPLSGVVAFQVTLTNQPGNFPQDTLVTVNLPAGVTFSQNLVGAALTSSQTTQGSVQSGGADGDSSVQFVLSEANMSSTALNFALPVEVSACPDGAGIDVIVLDTQNNLFVEGDAVVNTNEAAAMPGDPVLLPPCEDAFPGEIVADDPEKEIRIGAGGADIYETIFDGVTSFLFESLQGTYEFTPNPAVAIDAAGTPASATQIASVDWTVTVEDEVGLDYALNLTTRNLNGAIQNVNFDNFVPGDLEVELNGDDFVLGPNQIILASENNVNDRVPVANQDVSLSAQLNFVAGSGLTDKAPTVGALDPLNREGAVFGTFDWVGSAPGTGTATVLRVTGLPLNAETPYTLEMTNTPNGTYDGIYSGTVPAGNDGELALNSNNMFGVDNPVPFVRGDIQICFETEATDVDVDRLLVSNGVISAFNDGSNFNDLNSDVLVPLGDDDN